MGSNTRAFTAGRILAPLVLGMAGWFFTSRIVLATTLSVAIDAELLVVFSTAVPIGLGIYRAWWQRHWPAETKRLGLAAAALSAPVGGWLGFHTGSHHLAVVTTIVGATAATNLALIVVSVARERDPSSPAYDLSSTRDRRLVGAQLRPGDDVHTPPRS